MTREEIVKLPPGTALWYRPFGVADPGEWVWLCDTQPLSEEIVFVMHESRRRSHSNTGVVPWVEFSMIGVEPETLSIEPEPC